LTHTTGDRSCIGALFLSKVFWFVEPAHVMSLPLTLAVIQFSLVGGASD
jgi:hypothetical protein